VGGDEKVIEGKRLNESRSGTAGAAGKNSRGGGGGGEIGLEEG